MRMLIAAAAGAAAFAGAAWANPLYDGNTIEAVYADGTQIDWYLNSDGTFTNSVGMSGVYTEGDGEICVTPADETLEPGCSTFTDETREIGHSWTVTIPDGSEVQVTLVEGRPE